MKYLSALIVLSLCFLTLKTGYGTLFFLLFIIVLVILFSGNEDTSDNSISNISTVNYDPSKNEEIISTTDVLADEFESSFHNDEDISEDSISSLSSSFDDFAINPASGLPMISGIGSLDIGGNLYGTDSGNDDVFKSFDDNTFTSIDDNTFSSYDE